MKTRLTLIKGIALLVLLSTFNPQLSTAFAQGTAITYQGRLTDASSPANGRYDLRFTVFDALAGGSAVGGPLTSSATVVSNGEFTVVLDFGAVFPGANRWLEVAARTNGNIGNFSVLSPRQPLTAAPYAVTAGTVTGVVPNAGLSGIYGGQVSFVNNANNFLGNGSGLIDLNANFLANGTVPSAALNNAWKTTGNTGTSPTNGNFIGTTDSQPLDLKAGGMRVLRLQPDPRTDVGGLSGNLIGGYISNVIEAPESGGDFIGGGGYPAGPNIIHSNSSGVFIGAGSANQIGPNINDSFIGAGFGNTIQSAESVIAGGNNNSIQANGTSSAILGGQNNVIAAGVSYSVIGGGVSNTVNGPQSTVGGGYFNSNSGLYATIGGGYQNTIQTNAYYVTIGGGAYHSIGANSASTTIGGGYSHTIMSNTLDATISGGSYHVIGTNSYYTTIAGGRINTIGDNATASSIAGGFQNTVLDDAGYSAIGGGNSNSVLGSYAVVPGGYSNSAFGNYSFAAGNSAQALDDGTFVWSDATGTPFSSTAPNQFLVHASGGVGINTSNPAGAALNVAGTVKATAFQGDGSGLFNLNSGAALGNYVFAYSAGTISVGAANTFQDIFFNVDAQINGWTHTPGTAPYTSAQTGLYLIQYDASATTTTAPGATVSVHATLNLTEIPGSQASVVLSTNSIQLGTISRSFIASFNTSDVLTLQVAGSSTGSRLTSTGSGSIRPCVSMTITRIQ